MNGGKSAELNEVSTSASNVKVPHEASSILPVAVDQDQTLDLRCSLPPDLESLEMNPQTSMEPVQTFPLHRLEDLAGFKISTLAHQAEALAAGCASASNNEGSSRAKYEEGLLFPCDRNNNPDISKNMLDMEVWANLIAKSESLSSSSSNANKTASTVRLVEFIGDQFQQKNPHTRRTIILNQKRNSDNDPIVLYRFYQFCCPCLGKVWFSPLHRARFGCYCRDCHQYLTPFGFIDGLTPYMGHELCYAKFQCHRCGRSWSCQKSRSNFPDNCFSCGTIVYPYYQVSHSVLQKKVLRNEPLPGPIPHPGPFTGMIPLQPTVPSVDEDEEYQMCEPESEDEYFDVDTDTAEFQDYYTTAGESIQDNDDVSVIFHPENGMRARSSYSSICVTDSGHQNPFQRSHSEKVLTRSISDSFLIEKHRYWDKKHEARLGFARYHFHRK